MSGKEKKADFEEPLREQGNGHTGIELMEVEAASTMYPGEMDPDDGEVTLMYARHEKIPMKDFAAEIRASLDIENFLNQAVIVLDIDATSLNDIVETILHKLLDEDEPKCTLDEAKGALFTHDNVHHFAKTIQATSECVGGAFDYDQSWICAFSVLPSLNRRHVAIARLSTPANLGTTHQEVQIVVLVLAPVKEKGTKNALETARSFSTLFADIDFRHQLLEAKDKLEVKHLVWEHAQALAEEQSHPERKLSVAVSAFQAEEELDDKGWSFAKGLRKDLWRRLPHYWSDYKDGIIGNKTPHKVAATTLFLYFACILPSIAFGVLNDDNTKGKIDVKKVIFSQTVGGLFFGLFGGQPLIVLLTTAPLALYIKVIYNICEDFSLDFYAMYCAVGLWNCFFLLIFAVFDLSKLMKWSTRSTEEIFAVFISIAFSVDAIRDLTNNFMMNYDCSGAGPAPVAPTNQSFVNASLLNSTMAPLAAAAEPCLRENSLLYLLLVLGTLWLGVSLFNFTQTPFLNAGKREILADYALPVAVITMSFFGSFVFKDVKLKPFNYYESNLFVYPELQLLSVPAIFGAMGLGFCLSLLFFMDQNISSAMVNSPANKLKKGSAYHWDLLVVAVINGLLSGFGLPWVHAALPHSPLHVRALADVEDRVDQGHVNQIVVRVRETRLTALFSHTLIGLSLLLLPYPLAYIPKPVLMGLFLYVAVTAMYGNQFGERMMLLFTEQAAYPPNHYIRNVPQRKIHMFTLLQILQLLLLCAFSFYPYAYLKMTFPVLILLMLPVRHKLIPLVIDKKYLNALDGHM